MKEWAMTLTRRYNNPPVALDEPRGFETCHSHDFRVYGG